jgi:hypothetical protein
MQRARGINAGPARESMLPAGELVRGPWLRGRSKGRTRDRHAGERTGHIAGNMHRPDLDKRPRLSAGPGGSFAARPRMNVTHTGPEQAGNARRYADHNPVRPG